MPPERQRRPSSKKAARPEPLDVTGKEPPTAPPTAVGVHDGGNVERVLGIMRTMDVVELRELKGAVVDTFLR